MRSEYYFHTEKRRDMMSNFEIELDEMMTSSSVDENKRAATYGRARHFSKVFYDMPPSIKREYVLHLENPELVTLFVDDDSAVVREAVAMRGNPELWSVLVKDCDARVRSAVAHYANAPIRLMLINDESSRVRFNVAYGSRNNKQVLEVLAEDSDPDVSFAAFRLLNDLLDMS